MKQLKIIISGGGTGGHIFPAIAIANALKDTDKNIEFLFVGAEGKMEMEKVPAAGYKIIGLWISGFQRKLTLSNLSFPLKLIASLWKAKKIIKEFKPDVVIGTGGYASGAVLKIASTMHIPTLIQEQNSYPGITNKLLATKVNTICVAYDKMEQYFPKEKIIVTGNPVRQDIQDISQKKKEALAFFKLSHTKKTILVIGGSLGAKTINESILSSIELFTKQNIQVIWQTGKSFYPMAVLACKDLASQGIFAFDFIAKMDYAYAAADIVISRAGASSISELCIVGKPTILIPSPNVAEDHQTKNAMTLVEKNAALLIKDIDAKEKLGKTIIELITNGALQLDLSKNILKLAFKNSANEIAKEVLKLVK